VDGESLCEHCRFMREVVSGRGSRFLLCELPRHDRRFPEYPPQPVVRCAGYADWEEGERNGPTTGLRGRAAHDPVPEAGGEGHTG
jgi:hypothetical protein